MTPALASILESLDIRVVHRNAYREPMDTHAAETMQRIMDRYGDGHLVMVLRSIAETVNNKRELVAPTLWAVSDTINAHPDWAASTDFLDALDAIDLGIVRQIAKENRHGSPLRHAINTMIYLHLREKFAPEKQGRFL